MAESKNRLAKLIVEAAGQTVEQLAALPGGAGSIPEVSFDAWIVVPVEYPAERRETRANIVATNGTVTVLGETRREPEPFPVIERNWAAAKAWPKVSELIELVRSLESEEHKQLYATKNNAPVPVAEQYTRVILSRTIPLLQLPAELARWSELAAERLLVCLSLAGEKLQYVAPLVGFDAEPRRPFELNSELRLRPLSEEDRRELVNPKTILGRFQRVLPGHLAFEPTSWVLEMDVIEPLPGHQTKSAEVLNQIQAFVGALKIFKDGRFDFTGIGCRDLPGGMSSFGIPNPWFPSLRSWSPFDRPYRLDPNEFQRALQFVQSLVRRLPTRNSGWIEISSTRLNDAFRRELDRDQLVDSLVLLEAVLLHDGEGEFSFRMATRGALLLGSTAEEKGELRRMLKSAYDRRSKILHGKDDPGRPGGAEVREVARRILFEVIRRTESMGIDNLLHYLDDYAVSQRNSENLDDFLRRMSH